MFGGKSYFLRWAALGLAMYYSANGMTRIPVGLFSEDYPTLRDRQISKITAEFPPFLGELKATQEEGLCFFIAPRYGSGRILLRNLDDPSKYMSTEFAAICVEEFTKDDKLTFDNLRTRLRFPGINDPKFLAVTNPGGPGHVFVKALWIDKNVNDPEREKFKFIKATIDDNKFATDAYRLQLDALPERLRKAYKDGNWDAFEGQFFSAFDAERELVEPFDIPMQWRLIGSLDPGASSPCSFGLSAVDFEGNIYRIATYYEAGLSGTQNVHNIAQFIRDCKYTQGRRPDYTVSGLDAWAHKDRYALIAHERTLADLFADVGMPLMRAITDRIPGWWAWKNLMPNRYFVFKDHNKPLLDELGSAIADDRNPEDIQGRGNDPRVADHALDESRYMVMAATTVSRPIEQPITARDATLVYYDEVGTGRDVF